MTVDIYFWHNTLAVFFGGGNGKTNHSLTFHKTQQLNYREIMLRPLKGESRIGT